MTSLGELPPAARRRLTAARESEIWSSSMTPGEEGALRSVGFVPVGIVTASIPSWPYGYQYPAALRSAAARSSSSTGGRGPYGTYRLIDDALTAKRSGGFTRDYVEGTYGILPDTGFSWEKVATQARERSLVSGILERLQAEATALGAHGIVAIQLRWQRRPDLDFGELEVHDVSATGVAIKSPDTTFDHEPFTAALSGAAVCALLRHGLAPSQVAFGIGVVRADMGNRTRRHMRSLGQVEVPQFSEAVDKSLTIATADLEHTAAPGDIIVGCKPEVAFERIVGAGLECRVRIVGTAMRRFTPPGRPDVLAILRLNDRAAP